MVSVRAQSLTERLDSILASPADTHQVRSLLSIFNDFASDGGEVPDQVFERGMKLARELNDERGLALLYNSHYAYSLNSGKFEQGMESVAQAIKYARSIGETRLLRKALKYQAIFLMINGETEKAAKRASAMAKEFHDSGDLIGESGAYSLLSILSSGFGNHEMAMTNDSIAIALARRSKSNLTIVEAVSRAATNMCLLREYELALPLAEEALLIARELKSEVEIANALSVRAEANTGLGNYDLAFKDFTTLKVGEAHQKSSWRMVNKGILLQRIGRHEEARDLLLEAETMIKASSNDPLELKRCYRGLQTVGLNQEQYDSVVWYGILMQEQQDSLQTAKNIKNLQELEEKYKAEEKEVEIRFQQEQLATQRRQLQLTVWGLGVTLLAGIGFFLLSQRLRRRNQENESLLRDKETLIGEIHHRVKNNLQVVSSLLQLQRRGLDSDDDKGQEALLESQSRVSAMGLIHNKLYQGKEVTSVYMPEYLEDLGETLLDAYRLEERVEIFYDVADVSLDVDVAIPLGLIINELVTNSLKYAFPEGREGTIEIALHRMKDQLRLVVFDNGVGAAAAEKRTDSTSFGSNLIGLLAKKLKGSLRTLEGKGYGVEISFTD